MGPAFTRRARRSWYRVLKLPGRSAGAQAAISICTDRPLQSLNNQHDNGYDAGTPLALPQQRNHGRSSAPNGRI